MKGRYDFVCAGVLLAFLAPAAFAAPVTISDTQSLISYGCHANTPFVPAKLDFAAFNFNNQPLLKSLTGIEFSMTMQDGDTAPGDFDFDQITLGLDGMNTGLKLNGFKSETSQDQETTLTFKWSKDESEWLSGSQIQSLLSNLQDHFLVGSLMDKTPDDNCINLYPDRSATLKLIGEPEDPNNNNAPEPVSLLVWGVSGLGLAYTRLRRRPV